jgi:hypothetical protein
MTRLLARFTQHATAPSLSALLLLLLLLLLLYGHGAHC